MTKTPQLGIEPRCSGRDGFTLVEVLVAVVLMTIGVLMAFATLDRAESLGVLSVLQDEASTAAAEHLDSLLDEPYGSVADGFETNVFLFRPVEGRGGDDYMAKLNHYVTENEDKTKTVRVAVSYYFQGRFYTNEVSTLIAPK